MTSAIPSTTTVAGAKPDLKTTFNQAVGGTFYRQMMSVLRSSTGKAAYLDGGQTEQIFRGQLDELIIEKLTQANGDIFAGQLYDQFESQMDAIQKARAAASAAQPPETSPQSTFSEQA